AAIASAPYSVNVPRSTRSATFSRAVRPPAAWRLSTASGRASSRVSARRSRASDRSPRAVPSAGGSPSVSFRGTGEASHSADWRPPACEASLAALVGDVVQRAGVTLRGPVRAERAHDLLVVVAALLD